MYPPGDEESEGFLHNEYSSKPAMNNFRHERRPQPPLGSFLLKSSFQSVLLAVNVVGLSILILGFSSLLSNHTKDETRCGLSTDSLLGRIGWRTMTLESEQRFIDADPADFDSDNSTSIWSEIYPSAWIWVSNPSETGYGGGVKLVDYADDPADWDDTTEGFSIAVMHQLHCVAQLKRSLIHYRRDGQTPIGAEHLDHCLEYLRQAVMCHSDLTLERPVTPDFPHGASGWGEAHRCRDWRQVIEAVREHALDRSDTGWKRLPKSNTDG